MLVEFPVHDFECEAISIQKAESLDLGKRCQIIDDILQLWLSEVAPVVFF